jgi:C-terminal processing protease CtpA/Prc
MVASSARFASQAKQIVLVDRWTASASEIVAKSLQKNGAVVIGEKTYGKGTGQQPILLGPAGQFGALKFTVSQMSVGGELLDHVGVHPDIPAITDADDWRYCSGTTDLHREICSQISNLPITRIVYE